MIEEESTTPTPPPAPGQANPLAPPAPALPGAPAASVAPADAALISINVPANSKVFVNGAATSSTGAARQFVSRGLTNGRQYTYEIRAEWMADGKPATDTKTVQMSAGEQTVLDFTGAETQNVSKPTRTKLTLNVPTDAKVYLAGRETSSTGAHREFVSNKVSANGDWQNYAVKVVATVNGKTVTKEKNVRILPGNDQVVSFDFDQDVTRTAAR